MIPFYYHVQCSSIHHQFDHCNICYSTKKITDTNSFLQPCIFQIREKKSYNARNNIWKILFICCKEGFLLLAFNVFIFWIKVRTKSKAVYMKANCIWRICINFICILLTLNLKGYLCIRLLSSSYAKKIIKERFHKGQRELWPFFSTKCSLWII